MCLEKQNKWKELGLYFSGCVRWLALAVLVGVLVGGCGTAFGVGLHWATQTRAANPWLIWLLPLAGVGVVTMYRTAGQPGGGSVNAAFVAVRTKVVMPLVPAPLIFIATIVTHLFGGSAGREGAGLLLGGSLADLLPKSFGKLETEDIILLLILYLLYRESGDSELLIIMGAMFLL